MSFGVCLPFLLAGLFIAARRPAAAPPASAPNAARFRGVILVMLLAGLYCLVHLLTWTLIRYRLPVDAMVMPFAAVAIVHVFHRVSGSIATAETS
jgi:hypothetical protein